MARGSARRVRKTDQDVFRLSDEKSDKARLSDRWRRAAEPLVRIARSRRAKVAVAAVSGALAIVLGLLAARHFAAAGWPLSHGHPALLVAAGLLFLVAYAFKAYGWRRLFAPSERPRPLALAAANGGASVTGVALPGRFDDVVRIAIVRRSPGCPAGVRTLCLSLFMLGLIDAVALTPLAAAAVAFPGQGVSVRAGLALVVAVGLGAAALVIALPRLVGSERLTRFRLGRWLSTRTTPLRSAAHVWALVSACWIVRAGALLLLLGALGIGLSVSRALLFLCAGAAASALPIGPAGAATQVGAGAAVLIASGVDTSQAVGFAVAVQAMGVLAGGAILLAAVLWHAALRLGSRRRPAAAA